MAKVMVIDDDIAIVELLETMLALDGYEAVHESDSCRAVSRVREEAPDLILLDLMMPEIDGWQVLAALQRDGELQDIPVVMVTASADVARVVQDPTRYGLAGLVVKPFDFDSLSQAVRCGLSSLMTPAR